MYNTKGGLYPSLSPPIAFEPKGASNYRSTASSNDEINSYFSDHHKQKFRRPGLRSTVSELPARGVKSVYLDSMSSKSEKRKFRNSHFRCSSSSGEEEDEENAPLLYYSSPSSNTRRKRFHESRKYVHIFIVKAFMRVYIYLYFTFINIEKSREICLQCQYVVVGYPSSVFFVQSYVYL